jgi:hypothetical protein
MMPASAYWPTAAPRPPQTTSSQLNVVTQFV